jgi:hypothetical protein
MRSSMSFMWNHVIHVKSCHSCEIMPFVSNHVIHVIHVNSCHFMSIRVNSCHSCHLSLDFSGNSLKLGWVGSGRVKYVFPRPSGNILWWEFKSPTNHWFASKVFRKLSASGKPGQTHGPVHAHRILSQLQAHLQWRTSAGGLPDIRADVRHTTTGPSDIFFCLWWSARRCPPDHQRISARMSASVNEP